jgi:hypothetical protein
MMKKIVGILVCTLLIVTALSATGTTNVQTTQNIKDNNYLEPYPSTSAYSPSIIAVNFVVEVKNVVDPFNLLGGAIHVGDKIRGKYNYDTGTPDSEPDPHRGIYEHTSSTYGIELKAGGLVFKTNPSDVKYGIEIVNDYGYSIPIDEYRVVSVNNLQLSNGMEVYMIHLELIDLTANALSSDALPTTVPDVSDWTIKNFTIMGYDPSSYNMFQIEATVIRTSISRSNTRDVHYYTTQPILIWLLERFPNLYPIIKNILKFQ